ncbi:MAG: RluA family pseudouridine synthase [Bacteroidales bacterium]|nr:RluA family pseudouridine synthase [Bacteroidales bacterium]
MVEDFSEDQTEDQELYEHYSFIVDKGQSALRIDKFLSDRLENASRTKIQQAATANCILVNQQAVKSNYKVKGGDQISIVLPEPPRVLKIFPENIPINIVYEDADVIVVDKQAGLVVHPGYGNYTGTLVNALAYHIKDSELFHEDNLRPGLVHRIDKNTSGLMVVAKTEFALTHLAKQFYDHSTDRQYLAMVWGTFDDPEGVISGYLSRDKIDRKKMHLYANEEEGKWSLTHYKMIENLGYVSLVECRLETGRTHQIRAHFEHLKKPLFNDERYGGNEILRGTTFSKYKQFVENVFQILPRHALHAQTLGFTHPITKERLFFESPIPNDIQMAIEKWRKYISSRSEN